MEHKLGNRELALHERVANDAMEQLGFDEIPEFLRCLHQELINRFAALADEADKESEFRRRRYVEICNAHETKRPATPR